MGAFQSNDRERGHYTQEFALMQDHLDDKWKRLLAASRVLSLTGSLDLRILDISHPGAHGVRSDGARPTNASLFSLSTGPAFAYCRLMNWRNSCPTAIIRASPKDLDGD